MDQSTGRAVAIWGGRSWFPSKRTPDMTIEISSRQHSGRLDQPPGKTSPPPDVDDDLTLQARQRFAHDSRSEVWMAIVDIGLDEETLRNAASSLHDTVKVCPFKPARSRSFPSNICFDAQQVAIIAEHVAYLVGPDSPPAVRLVAPAAYTA